MKKIQFLLPAFALAALVFVGCSDDETNEAPVQTAATKLALADPAQAELTFAASAPEAQIVVLDTDAASVSVEQVLAEDETAAEWCEVSVLSATEIKVAPASNFETEVRSIKYRVSAGELAPVEFTVTQAAAAGDEPEPEKNTLSVNLEEQYGMYFFTAPAAGGQITVATVTTDAEEWTAEFDPGFDDEHPYCSLQTASGVNGNPLIVVFEANNDAVMPSGASVTISAGNADPITIYLNQEAPEATQVTVYAHDEEETELTSPYAVEFAQELIFDAEHNRYTNNTQEFSVDSNGEYEVKVVAEGTSDDVADAWLSAFGGYGSLTITVSSSNDTGAERKLDVILVGANNAELFRMKVTQAGPVAGGDESEGEE